MAMTTTTTKMITMLPITMQLLHRCPVLALPEQWAPLDPGHSVENKEALAVPEAPARSVENTDLRTLLEDHGLNLRVVQVITFPHLQRKLAAPSMIWMTSPTSPRNTEASSLTRGRKEELPAHLHRDDQAGPGLHDSGTSLANMSMTCTAKWMVKAIGMKWDTVQILNML